MYFVELVHRVKEIPPMSRSQSVVFYEFRESTIEAKSLELHKIRTFNGNVISDERVGFYRYQGCSNGVPVYRDLDGNFKPFEQLTVEKDD